MANEIRLEAFYIKISDKFKQKKKEDKTAYYFGDVEGRDFLIDCVVKFIDENKKRFKKLDKEKKSFDVQPDDDKNYFHLNDRVISGVVESGEYGYGSKIKDENGKTKYKKPSDESNDLPFYFLFYIPKGSLRAILILQKTGVHSISGVFNKELVNYVRDKFHNYKLDFSQIMSPELANEILLNGDKQEIILTKYEKSTDIFDKLGDGKNNDSSEVRYLKAQLSFSSKGFDLNFLNEKLRRFIENKKAEVFSIPEYGFNADDIIKTTVRVKYNGSIKTIDLSENLNIRVAFDIEKDYEILKDEDRHPIFNSINDIGLDVLEEIKNM